MVDSTKTQPSRPAARSDARSGGGLLPTVLVGVLLLALVAAAAFAGWMALGVGLEQYEGRVYPNVTVMDVDLGGLTPDEARARLAAAQETYRITLRDGDHTWLLPWHELGLRLDVEATVEAAMAAGRADRGIDAMINIWFGQAEAMPVLGIHADTARARLEQISAQFSIPPVDAALALRDGQLIAVPGHIGRVLDVQMTVDRLVVAVAQHALDDVFELTFVVVPPQVTDAAPARDQAQALLERQVRVVTYDVLTDQTFEWTLGRDEVVTWLRVEQVEGGGLRVRPDLPGVRATLAELAAELGEGRGLLLDEGAAAVLQAFEAGGGSVQLYMTHPERTVTVQSGDTIMSIGRRLGVPPGLVIEANPNIDPNRLSVGQQLTIPSQNTLTPYMPVIGRRIVISIPAQRMRVYQDGALLYDWRVSTGIATSPTGTGVFQVLGKEENAYASQWDLWMPHFIAVYRAGGEVYNGIHALPIMAGGRRLWEGSLGSPASYGCIILGIQEAETLYHWAEIGVVVVIE